MNMWQRYSTIRHIYAVYSTMFKIFVTLLLCLREVMILSAIYSYFPNAQFFCFFPNAQHRSYQTSFNPKCKLRLRVETAVSSEQMSQKRFMQLHLTIETYLIHFALFQIYCK